MRPITTDARLLAEQLCRISRTGTSLAEEWDLESAAATVGLTSERALTAARDLARRGLVSLVESATLSPPVVLATAGLFFEFDGLVRKTDVRENARRAFAAVKRRGAEGITMPELDVELGLEPRDVNPAAMYLVQRSPESRLVESGEANGERPYPWLRLRMSGPG